IWLSRTDKLKQPDKHKPTRNGKRSSAASNDPAIAAACSIHTSTAQKKCRRKCSAIVVSKSANNVSVAIKGGLVIVKSDAAPAGWHPSWVAIKGCQAQFDGMRCERKADVNARSGGFDFCTVA